MQSRELDVKLKKARTAMRFCSRPTRHEVLSMALMAELIRTGRMRKI